MNTPTPTSTPISMMQHHQHHQQPQQQQQQQQMPLRMPMPENMQYQQLHNYTQSVPIIQQQYAAISNEVSDITKDYTPTDWDFDPNDFNVIKKSEIYATMSRDYTSFTKMNLLDDENLDNLYYLQEVFNDPQKTFNIIYSMYTEKYEQLISKYPSIANYISMCIYAVVKQDENQLSRLALSSTIPAMPYNNNNLMGKMKRAFALKSSTTASSSSSSSSSSVQLPALQSTTSAVHNNNNSAPYKTSSIRNMNRPKHPFFDTDIYNKKPIIFSIGNCSKYCRPSDFALLGIKFTNQHIKKYGAGKEHEIYLGMKMDFEVPICTAVASRQSAKNNSGFYVVEKMDVLESSIAPIAKFQFNRDGLTMGKNANLVITDFDTQMPRTDVPGVNIAIISHFGVHKLKNASLSGRCYANNMVFLASTILLAESELDGIVEIAHSQMHGKDEPLKEYRKQLKEFKKMKDEKLAEFEKLRVKMAETKEAIDAGSVPNEVTAPKALVNGDNAENAIPPNEMPAIKNDVAEI